MKRISLDQMKNMSLDNLIELYRDGYRLEEHTPINSLSNFHTIDFYNIRTLQGPLLDPVVNFGKVTVSTGYDAITTSITLNANEGSKFPDPSVSGAFNLVWWNSTDYPDPSDDPNKEIVRCTARITDTLTVTRAQEGTSSSIKNLAGKTYKMILSPTAKMISDIRSELAALSATGSTFASGTYTGDSTNNRAIAHGLGVKPRAIFIQKTGTAGSGGSYLWNNIEDTKLTISEATEAIQNVIAKDATNFYLGPNGATEVGANVSNNTYAWVAIGAGGGGGSAITTGSFITDGTANRAIAHNLGVTPKQVHAYIWASASTGRIGWLNNGKWQMIQDGGPVWAITTPTAPDATNFYVGPGDFNPAIYTVYWSAMR